MIGSLVAPTRAVLASLLIAWAPLAAQTPTNLEQIPIYAGAKRQPAREADLRSPTEEPGVYGDLALRMSTVRAYRVAAGIEDVVRFYQRRLSARERKADADRERTEVENLSVGQVSSVTMELEPVDLSPGAWAESATPGGESAAEVARAVRAAYTKARSPFQPGRWLVGAEFRWAYRASTTGVTELSIGLEDTEGFEIRDPAYHNETEIVIWVRVWDTPEEAEAQEERPRPVRRVVAPTEATLGVPLYPGATFAATMSGELSTSDEEADYYVFTSTDPSPKVASFYEQRTGKHGMRNEAGVLIVVRGEGLFPDLGVTIQPNSGTFPKPVQSIITVRKRR